VNIYEPVVNGFMLRVQYLVLSVGIITIVLSVY